MCMLQDEIKAHMHGVNSGGAYSQCDNFLLVSCLLIEFKAQVGGIWWHLIAKFNSRFSQRENIQKYSWHNLSAPPAATDASF